MENMVLETCTRILSEWLDIISPSPCQLCDGLVASQLPGGICESCIKQIKPIVSACRQCGAPIPEVTNVRDDCLQCRSGDWPADRIFAYSVYEGKIAEGVVHLKHPGSDSIAKSLGTLVGRWFEEQILREYETIPKDHYDLIVPTPKHWRKNWKNHHNAAQLLGSALASYLALPFHADTLKSTRVTSKQGTLLNYQRAENVRGAFAVNDSFFSKAPRYLEGTRVLLIDDIVTSGSTSAELVRVLKKAKASRVDVLAVARGIGFGRK
jgi:ComF family protein